MKDERAEPGAAAPADAAARPAPRGPAVICLGGAHWDMVGRPSGPLAPGGDLPGRMIRRPGGVALNLALSFASLGRPTVLAAPVGRDPEGAALAARLSARGVSLRRMGPEAPTGLYLAIEDGAGGLAAAVADLPGCEAALPEHLREVLTPTAANAAAWVIEANLPAETLAAIVAAHAALPPGARPWLVANPASPARAERLAGLLGALDLLICNRAEAETLAGRRFEDAAQAAAALRALGLAEVAVTDGPAPAAAADAQGVAARIPIPAPAAPSLLMITGAGDALFAAYLHARLKGEGATEALEHGLRAARARMETAE
ncbi:PfkB family carbohydrate kinase [Albimonas sp. CAU 1670]|uniref:PfkB family carbohydrate kinase n=1 Tax=Albimonas sp. CAU 1670 TaxID=3032599 RepID=UPI0023DA65DB|nr:PfkB family carbohydrate kinase [Albimonas sp. CAU 1670]MDF2235477.1 PfkB family carbohydrate kinase [Albimonas sp. CAU 1670]